jgi:cytochrome c551/c552
MDNIRVETFGSAWTKAFAAFQGEVQNPKLTANNPHFKSKYSPLSEVLNTVRPILAKNGLSVQQDIGTLEDKVVCVTTVFHESGEYYKSTPFVISGSRGGKPADAQGFGSAASYAKRYQLQAVLGVAADEDDDGEAIASHNNQQQYTATQKPAGPSKQTLAAKYQLGTGSRDGFDEYYNKQIAEGKDHKYIDGALDKAIAKKKSQNESEKQGELQPTT